MTKSYAKNWKDFCVRILEKAICGDEWNKKLGNNDPVNKKFKEFLLTLKNK